MAWRLFKTVIYLSVISVNLVNQVLSAPVAAAAGGKTADAHSPKVIEQSNDYKADEFNWSYELSDGRVVRQNAYKKMLDDGTEVLVINGFYSYYGPDGIKYTVSYYSDENGYHPDVIVGELPEPPQYMHIDPKVLASLVG
ncbi:endocuticle structural glycoprotein ABD-5-like [Uranotaenia lowii]|uniref:endocuticle structural glycoprotein ABD-5-like n=1 Tax=Uranotaenia lowii TaxID=190385 RepID=UPI00247AF546|nr:endocuticle structural glycoprotein ABD-5-like [Uranotaenia lowii]